MVSPLRPLIFAGLLAAAASAAFAQISYVDFLIVAGPTNSNENTGVAASGQFKFDASIGKLELTLNNLSGTSTYTNGVLTSFGFEVNNSLTYVANSFSQTLLTAGEPHGINFKVDVGYQLAPYVMLDIGAITGANEQGGSTKDGLSGSHSARFTFSFAGDLTKFNAWDFFTSNPASNPDMILRFQGVGARGDDSDKVTWVHVPTFPPIPEPSTYGLMGAGALVGMAIWRRRRRA